MFFVEFLAGWIAESTGLIADSLDMFADAAVYAVSLYAVGRAANVQMNAARMSGVFQLILALGALAEVVRRFVVGSEPEPPTIMAIALLALAANVSCMALISKHRAGGVHMRASWIFSTNDVIANIGVIAAGALVAWTGSALPDLAIGALIALVVFSGAVRILKLGREASSLPASKSGSTQCEAARTSRDHYR
jgi:Co/Zn/Cd efflux system component